MKILQINSVPYGSTAKIMIGIANVAAEKGHEVYTANGYSYHPLENIPNNYQVGSMVGKAFHIVVGRLFGLNERLSSNATKRLIKHVQKIKPDVIHLHNLHGNYLSIKMLFDYIKSIDVKVVWTLHDCWAFTGHCPHYVSVGCKKWQTGCYKCSSYRAYPQSLVDDSKKMWQLKKDCTSGIKDLTIITPSKWLKEQVEQSFLKDYPVRVIHNGINLSDFKPRGSDFRRKHGISDEQKMLLGVTLDWGAKKGLDVFIRLAKELDDGYKIVLVGTNDKIDKLLPKNIISIHRTQNAIELAEIYTAADLFVNPTREDNFPTVNIEALACGTPVVTFRTGGSPEVIDSTCGSVANDYEELKAQIVEALERGNYTTEACLKRAKAFDQAEKFKEYLSVYEK